ncbi:pyridoxamine 5'-phosphate oxidase [Polaribacter reichenbachii]|uniref:Pyridoxamine 5'-phosphate oxidase n=1 Tax=Polaribacter reichenbachii TaxID=996801 RepID=A0A1B8TUL3_9FLAO|nr:pyridoxamine 5'-phosphate oxidase family protein [Polaribacter reichenbachii]APZ45727.1 pyridoxamine 5'-phosphate oxidase [Polaribacter reichenbachii]AUC19588.1 pyridoxamine 5'-phosphate oxidase [Polaribacter reichenbachii]OBY63258.1 pyridoxamine 5'-phosphate oxidase [Polaribacter reichenbachii]
MSKFYTKITSRLQKFIEAQKIFFVATAPNSGRINLSPKGMDSFRVMSENRVLWLNVTGSGNETAAHLLENERITIMFCSFDKAPNILRLYGKGKEIKEGDENWNDLIQIFPEIPGTRQIFDITVDSAQTSCGMSIPFFDYKGERNDLNDWAAEQGKEGIANYWENKNQTSIDGLPTKILE